VRDGVFDLVMSGAVIVHMKEYKAAVRELARATSKWLLLHRTLVYVGKQPTSMAIEHHYHKAVYCVRINEGELLALMRGLNMDLVIKCDAGQGRLPAGEENNTYLWERCR